MSRRIRHDIIQVQVFFKIIVLCYILFLLFLEKDNYNRDMSRSYLNEFIDFSRVLNPEAFVG